MKILKFLFGNRTEENKHKTSQEENVHHVDFRNRSRAYLDLFIRDCNYFEEFEYIASKDCDYDKNNKDRFNKLSLNKPLSEAIRSRCDATNNTNMFFNIHREIKNYIVNYHNKVNSAFNYKDTENTFVALYNSLPEGDELDRKYFEILFSFINEIYKGKYIDQIYECAQLANNKKEITIKIVNNIEKNLEVLKYVLTLNKEWFPKYDYYSQVMEYPITRISNNNYDKFLKIYYDLQDKINTINLVNGAEINSLEKLEWPRNYNLESRSTWDWRFGEIPIIPKFRHCPMGAYIGITSIEIHDERVPNINALRKLEEALKTIPEYCYLREKGKAYNYYSLFEAENNPELHSRYKQLFESHIFVEEIGDNYYIENLSLNEIKDAVNNIKQKLQEEIDQEEIRQKQIKEEQDKQLLKERWEKINKTIKYEVLENNLQSFLSGVYIIRCIPLNYIYIGSSDNMMIRKSQHLQMLRSNSHHSYRFQEAFNSYGESNFTFHAIETLDLNSDVVNNSRILKQIEQYYINEYNPEFNIEKDAFGKKHYQ